jgi:hypothetical protein
MTKTKKTNNDSLKFVKNIQLVLISFITFPPKNDVWFVLTLISFRGFMFNLYQFTHTAVPRDFISETFRVIYK